jgi:hypothetical protein
MASYVYKWGGSPSRKFNDFLDKWSRWSNNIWDFIGKYGLFSSLNTTRIRVVFNAITGDVLGKIVVLTLSFLSSLIRILSFGQLRYYTKRWDPRFRCQQWFFMSRGLRQGRDLQCSHKVHVRHNLCKTISITVDDHEHDTIVWEQNLWDVLDFGGKFRFTITSPECLEHDNGYGRPIQHDCLIVIHPWFINLYVDGVNVESGKAYVPSTFRLVIRLVTLLACFFIFCFPFRSSPNVLPSSSLGS